MHFQDIGIVIGKKLIAESSYIILVFTKKNGIFSGIIKTIGKKRSFLYQEGDLVEFFWQARLAYHTGIARCELIKSYSQILINSKIKLFSFYSIISLIKLAFQEREAYEGFFHVFESYLNSSFDFRKYIQIELLILAESGYKLNLNSCVVTGVKENLHYLSPKSGQAVCFTAGLKYANKLLTLPKFLINNNLEISEDCKRESFEVTSYFFKRYLFFNKKQPIARKIFIDMLFSRNLF